MHHFHIYTPDKETFNSLSKCLGATTDEAMSHAVVEYMFETMLGTGAPTPKSDDFGGRCMRFDLSGPAEGALKAMCDHYDATERDVLCTAAKRWVKVHASEMRTPNKPKAEVKVPMSWRKRMAVVVGCATACLVVAVVAGANGPVVVLCSGVGAAIGAL
jgi:hypothetical protein